MRTAIQGKLDETWTSEIWEKWFSTESTHPQGKVVSAVYVTAPKEGFVYSVNRGGIVTVFRASLEESR